MAHDTRTYTHLILLIHMYATIPIYDNKSQVRYVRFLDDDDDDTNHG